LKSQQKLKCKSCSKSQKNLHRAILWENWN